MSAAGRLSWRPAGRCDGLRGWGLALVLSSFAGAVTGLCGVAIMAIKKDRGGVLRSFAVVGLLILGVWLVKLPGLAKFGGVGCCVGVKKCLLVVDALGVYLLSGLVVHGINCGLKINGFAVLVNNCHCLASFVDAILL